MINFTKNICLNKDFKIANCTFNCNKNQKNICTCFSGNVNADIEIEKEFLITVDKNMNLKNNVRSILENCFDSINIIRKVECEIFRENDTYVCEILRTDCNIFNENNDLIDDYSSPNHEIWKKNIFYQPFNSSCQSNLIYSTTDISKKFQELTFNGCCSEKNIVIMILSLLFCIFFIIILIKIYFKKFKVRRCREDRIAFLAAENSVYFF